MPLSCHLNWLDLRMLLLSHSLDFHQGQTADFQFCYMEVKYGCLHLIFLYFLKGGRRFYLSIFTICLSVCGFVQVSAVPAEV